MIARRAPLSAVLNLLCRNIQDQAPAARCSFVLLQEGTYLRHPAAPGLEKGAGDGAMIGPSVSSSTTAMNQRAPEIVPVAQAILSSGYSGMALSHGERFHRRPILSAKGEVLGTLDICYSEPRRPLDKKNDLLNEPRTSLPLPLRAIERIYL